MSKEGKAIKESYQWQAKSQYGSKHPLKGPIIASVRLYHGTKRKTDIDNFGKLLFDSLTGIVYEDDSQIMQATYAKDYDKSNPRIEIEIEEYGNEIT
jgi:Holliday junction resolvase RusA-like endonuclease